MDPKKYLEYKRRRISLFVRSTQGRTNLLTITFWPQSPHFLALGPLTFCVPEGWVVHSGTQFEIDKNIPSRSIKNETWISNGHEAGPIKTWNLVILRGRGSVHPLIFKGKKNLIAFSPSWARVTEALLIPPNTNSPRKSDALAFKCSSWSTISTNSALQMS